jgi:hypothetical protein
LNLPRKSPDLNSLKDLFRVLVFKVEDHSNHNNA